MAAAWIAAALLVVSGSFLAVSFCSGGIVADLFQSTLSGEEKLELFRTWVASFGAWAGLVYFGIVVVEVVVAPLPGPLLYAPAGYLFGTWLGGSIALVGNVVGAYLAYSLARLLGEKILPEPPEALVTRLRSRGFALVFWLRLNPLTSSDLVSYAAGFARLSPIQVVTATGLALAPSCYAYAWLAQELFARYPGLMLALAAVGTVALVVLAARLVGRMQEQEVGG